MDNRGGGIIESDQGELQDITSVEIHYRCDFMKVLSIADANLDVYLL